MKNLLKILTVLAVAFLLTATALGQAISSDMVGA